MIKEDISNYQWLWQSLTPTYDEGEAKSIVRLLLDKAFGLTLTDIYADGLKQIGRASCRERV